MYNLHCHSLLSDGVLLPSEVAVRYAAVGYKAIAITDHADYSNVELIVRSILNFTKHWSRESKIIEVLPGIELTHLPLEQIGPLAKYARKEGISVIIAHGETLVEPVLKGTNRAALEADIDILAHPGLISDAEVKLAGEKDIFLEVTTRKGHSDTNPHVVKKALELKAKLIINNDSHLPEDIIAPDELIDYCLKAGLSREDINKIYKDVNVFLKKRR